ncbi:50S ribosomal protein L24 [bacterium]|nr:50S ribosomal protein L24 [bacterium]
MNLRKGDEVMVLSGNDRGSRGKILSVNRQKFRAVVEGVALRKRHVRRTQQNPKGGVVEKEASIAVSNLMLVCPKCNAPSRMGRRRVDGRALRVCKKCNEAVPL